MSDEKKLIRDTFERAAGPDEPSIDRLLDAVPALQAEARRRSAAPATPARRLVPKLAVATAAIAILALLSIYSDRGDSRDPATLESLILSGSTGDEGDTLLDAVLSTDENDG